MRRVKSLYGFGCTLLFAASAFSQEHTEAQETSSGTETSSSPAATEKEAPAASTAPLRESAGENASGATAVAEPAAVQQPPSARTDPETSAKPQPPLGDLAQLHLQPDTRAIRFSAQAELGTLGVVAHRIQFGEAGTPFDYVRDGGQENLFPFARFSAEANLFRHHHLVFLYQPLTLETDVTLRENLEVYDTRFDAGTAMHLKYGFDFVRLSYFYDFWADPRQELGIGISLQIRNAIINFSEGSGVRLVANRNVGPVPILKARWRSTFDNDVFVGAEIDGFYANIPIANGDLESQVEGAICDASMRVGAPVVGFANAFVNLRYVGGGSKGFERGDDIEGDGFTDNWLHTIALSLGVELR